MPDNIQLGNFTQEGTMDLKLVGNLPLPIPTNFTIGSFTSSNFQPPQGEVMKLDIPNLTGTQMAQPAHDEALFGTHIREAIAVVKDWRKRP